MPATVHNILSVSADVLRENISRYLDVKDVARLAETNKRMSAALQSRLLKEQQRKNCVKYILLVYNMLDGKCPPEVSTLTLDKTSLLNIKSWLARQSPQATELPLYDMGNPEYPSYSVLSKNAYQLHHAADVSSEYKDYYGLLWASEHLEQQYYVLPRFLGCYSTLDRIWYDDNWTERFLQLLSLNVLWDMCSYFVFYGRDKRFLRMHDIEHDIKSAVASFQDAAHQAESSKRREDIFTSRLLEVKQRQLCMEYMLWVYNVLSEREGNEEVLELPLDKTSLLNLKPVFMQQDPHRIELPLYDMNNPRYPSYSSVASSRAYQLHYNANLSSVARCYYDLLLMLEEFADGAQNYYVLPESLSCYDMLNEYVNSDLTWTESFLEPLSSNLLLQMYSYFVRESSVNAIYANFSRRYKLEEELCMEATGNGEEHRATTQSGVEA